MASYPKLYFRTDSKFQNRIEEYMKKEKIENRSEAIRRLIEIGLSLPPPTVHNGGSLPKDTSEKNGRREFHVNEWGMKVYH